MPPFLTCISLTSNTGNDHRTIDLIPAKSYIVGRASRHKDNMRAAPGNALFDCAVMSREHAEIRSTPFNLDRSITVTITDKNSLHGTTVNGRKLMPHSPMALTTGDVITFGERVSRGEEAHEGISVTFRRIHQLDSYPEASQSPTTPRPRGFHVPDDSEQSDFDSDVEFFISSPHERSSAKTTPEQLKMGSQKQPIDLENAASSQNSVINLIDDEEDTVSPPALAASAPQPAPQVIVPDAMSLSEQSINVTASPPPPPLPSSSDRKPASFHGVQDSDFDNDDDDNSITEHNAGLSKILNDPDAPSDEELHFGEDNDVAQYVGYTDDEDDDIDSFDDSLGPSDDEGEGFGSEDEELTRFEGQSSERQPSEELGEPSVPASKAAWLDEFVEKVAAASKPRYDPVRSSQPPEDDSVNASALAQAPPALPTYITRWDLQPACTSQQQVDNISRAPLSPVLARGALMASSTIGGWSPTQSPQRADIGLYSLPQTTHTYGTSSTAATEGDMTGTSSKEAMAIGNLCAPAQQSSGAAESTQSNNAFLSQLSPTLAAEQVQNQATTHKRKADTVEGSQSGEPAAKKVITADAASGTQRPIAVPTTQRRPKQGLARQIVGAAAKHAASATVGAAATVAFLNSTYAERLIQYLS